MTKTIEAPPTPGSSQCRRNTAPRGTHAVQKPLLTWLTPGAGAASLLLPVPGVNLLMCVRRCPTLPHSFGCSTIGAVGLSFRVRNGIRAFPPRYDRRNPLNPNPLHHGWGRVNLWVTNSVTLSIQLSAFNDHRTHTHRRVWDLLVGDRLVDANTQILQLTNPTVWGVV